MFELISIGNELLSGKTLNTNLYWLCQRITSLGGIVTRAVTVRDDIDEISLAFRESLKRKPRWIISTGGLGPTYDDMTLAGLAKALKRKMVVSSKALDMIKEKYEQYVRMGVMDRFDLTPERIKMATLPKGAKPLRNDVGTAPGVLLKVSSTYIACLPGVPQEMKSIFDKELEKFIRDSIRGVRRAETCIRTLGILESSLSPIIDQVRSRFPRVYIKSHPQSFESGRSEIEIHLIATSYSKEESEKEVKNATYMLTSLLRESGAIIKDSG